MQSYGRCALQDKQHLDFTPFLNLMVVLIPLLIASAEFARISVIDIALPNAGASPRRREERYQHDDERLLLTAILTDSAITLGGRSGFLPSIYYREFHEYVTQNGRRRFTVEHTPGVNPRDPVSQALVTPRDRHDILLYATNPDGSIIQSLYTKYGDLLTDHMGRPVQRASVGDTLYEVTNPRRMTIVDASSAFALRPLSAYDELRNRLLKIRERYRDAKDADAIIIAAEDDVVYDKVVNIMDTAREADFPDISVSRLRRS